MANKLNRLINIADFIHQVADKEVSQANMVLDKTEYEERVQLLEPSMLIILTRSVIKAWIVMSPTAIFALEAEVH